jgi:hypothetical protein
MAYLWIVNPNSNYNTGVQTTASIEFPFYVDYTGERKETRRITSNGTQEYIYKWVGRQTLKEYLQAHPTYKVYNDKGIDARIEVECEKMCFNWWKIDYEQYMDSLEVLPPLRWQGNSFFISEADTQDVHAYYCKHNGSYYTTRARLSHKREDITKSLEKAIETNTIKQG